MAEIDLVRSPDEMDNDTFAKHMTLRHRDSLGGLPGIELPYRDNSLSEAWRAFHRRIHKLAAPGQLAHEHESGESGQTGPIPIVCPRR